MASLPRPARISSAVTAILLLSASSLLRLADAHALPALPRATKTVEYHEINALPWPLATAAPDSPEALLRRSENTICGYIGGDPGLPATCSAGSHCALDADHGVIGCCPNGGSCTQGVYTGCVDGSSGAQSEVNPYIFTCSGADSCYKNNFEGGYSQYGCGTQTNLATSVLPSATGKAAVTLTSLPATKTKAAKTKTKSKSKSKTKSKTKTKTKKTKTKTKTSSTSTSESTTATSSETTTTTESSSTSATSTSASSTATSGTGTAGAASSSGSSDSAPSTSKHKTNTGAIVGGVVGGVAALVALLALGILLWRKRQNQSTKDRDVALKEKIHAPSPFQDDSDNITPVTPAAVSIGLSQSRPRQQNTIVPVETDHFVDVPRAQQSPNYSYPYGSGSNPSPGPGTGIAMSDDSSWYHDETPLTRDSLLDPRDSSYDPSDHPRDTRELEEFSQGFNTALGRIDEEASRSNPVSPYPPRSRHGGGGPLWQQNRRDWV